MIDKPMRTGAQRPAEKKTPPKIYYIRGNRTSDLPSNCMFLDVETRAEDIVNGEAYHTMFLGWTWHTFINGKGEILRQSWQFHVDCATIAAEIEVKCQAKKPLYLLGSNITFDLFASGLADYFQREGWVCQMMYDKGLVTIIILKKKSRTIKILALQNFLQGSVKEWGAMLDLPKIDISLEDEDYESIKTYCKRDVEITGKTFLSYLAFLRHNDMGGFAPTLAGQSFRGFRHRFMKKKILHYDQADFNHFIRAGYYGGRVECGYIGKAKERSYTKLDINSMYPSIMRQEIFPLIIRQWINTPSMERIERRLVDHCITAQCWLNTDQPAYAVRRGGKLVFPVGRFRAHLSTGSLRYAIAHGHIEYIEHAAIFRAGMLFKDYVEHFYALRQQYRAEGNAVWEKTAKLLLNALYGKFGEKRTEELINELDDSGDFFRQEWYNVDTGDRGNEWCAWGRFVREGGEREGPQSAPAIAAHVTDYGRILLWKYIHAVGRDNVLYLDTDSLIIPTDKVHLLDPFIDESKLGYLKIEGTSNALDIRGNKDYSFGETVRRKGIRKGAYHNADGTYSQAHFPGLYSLLRAGTTRYFPIGLITKKLTHIYDKGTIQPSGFVEPFSLFETEKDIDAEVLADR